MDNVNVDTNTSDVNIKTKETEEIIESPVVSEDNNDEVLEQEVEKSDLQKEDAPTEVVKENIEKDLLKEEIAVEGFLETNEGEDKEEEITENEEKVEINPEEDANKQKKDELYVTFVRDLAEYEKLKEEYREWILKSKLIPIETIKCSKKICDDINMFLEIVKGLKEGELDEKINSFLESRIKGIKLIEKMINNVVKNNLSKFEQLIEEEISPLNSWENVKDMDIDVIQKTENENYNMITSLKAKKDSLIRNYFKFITSDILNIADGVQSGIQFLKQKKEMGEALNPVVNIYSSLERSFADYFGSINIQKIKVSLGDNFDINLHEAFDIEETDSSELNEKIFEVIRDGYIYNEPLFGMDYNYVIRLAQVIVYKKN